MEHGATLMHGLQAMKSSTAAKARAELIRRGFSEVHLELARRLFDPDPEVRKQLVRALPICTRSTPCPGCCG